MAIHQLSKELASQIAAGEVVERPASVVKELLENAVDSKASKIILEILQAGKTLIKVRDNGEGIVKEDLPLALAPHATSKISCLDDLEAISTLGFRGEALASIASVSHLTLISRAKDALGAYQVRVEGAQLNPIVDPAAHPQGTTVEVKELFFNTPGRRRFLKSDRTELSHIRHTFIAEALSHPEIAFEFLVEGKKELVLPKALDEEGKLKRIAKLLGSEYQSEAIKLNLEKEDLKVSGFLLAPPPLESSAIDDIRLILNGRAVEDKLLTHAVRSAFRECNGVKCSTRAVLFINCPFSKVDVNVHPRKLEVRFHEGRVIHDLLEEAIVGALKDAGVSAKYHQEAPALIAQEKVKKSEESLNLGKKVAEEEPFKAVEKAPFSQQDIDFFNQGSKVALEGSLQQEKKKKKASNKANLNKTYKAQVSLDEDISVKKTRVEPIFEESEDLDENSNFSIKPHESKKDYKAEEKALSHDPKDVSSFEDEIRLRSENLIKTSVNPKPHLNKLASSELSKAATYYDREIEKKVQIDLQREQFKETTPAVLASENLDDEALQILSMLEGKIAFIFFKDRYYLLRLDRLQEQILANEYEAFLQEEKVPSFSLSMPFAVKATKELIRALKQNQEAVLRCGFKIAFKKDTIVLEKIPCLLKGSDIASFALRALHFISSAAPSLVKGQCPKQLSRLLAQAQLKTFYAKDFALQLCKNLSDDLIKTLGEACLEIEVGALARDLSLKIFR